MRPILEVILSLLAVVGLLSLSWLLLGHILTPAGNGETVSLVPGQGDGEDLEQAVRGLPGVEVWPLSQLSVYIKRKEP